MKERVPCHQNTANQGSDRRPGQCSQHSHWDEQVENSTVQTGPDAFSQHSRVLPYPAPLPPAGEGPQGGKAPRKGHCRNTSRHRSQPCCPGDGSCRRHPRHPQGQLSSVGGSFHGGSPEGVQPRLWERARARGTFLLCPGTVGFYSRPAVSEGRTGPWVGGRLGLESPPPLGVLTQPGRRGRTGDRAPLPGPSLHVGGPPPTGARGLPAGKRLGEAAPHWVLGPVNSSQQPMGSLSVSRGNSGGGEAGLGGEGAVGL